MSLKISTDTCGGLGCHAYVPYPKRSDIARMCIQRRSEYSSDKDIDWFGDMRCQRSCLYIQDGSLSRGMKMFSDVIRPQLDTMSLDVRM